MKKNGINIKPHYALILGFVLILAGCYQASEKETNSSVGLNGGFEVFKNGLPVNWIIYSPKTVSEADFEIVLDNEVYKEGKQSLRFDVVECSSNGGRFSPGFTNEFFESGKFKGEDSYKLSFWVKNEGSTFKISAGDVSDMKGNMTTLIEEKEQISDWKLLEYHIDIPKDRWLRMELNILQPGTFWIDDIKIEKL